jgi:methyl-accepting chemotaxis protein
MDYKSLKFDWKLRLLGGAILACSCAALLAGEWKSEQSLNTQKMWQTRSLVETTASLIRHQVEAAAAGEMTEEEAKARAIAEVRELRYGNNDYFWIHDESLHMVMHPMKPELEGQDVSNMADPKGKKLFVEMNKVVEAKGSGLVSYLWPKPGLKDPAPKISYVQGIPEWGWVVGSGVYLDDIAAVIWKQRAFMLAALLFAWLSSWLLTHLLATAVTRSLEATRTCVSKAAEGDLTVRTVKLSKDELGQMAEDVNRMLVHFEGVMSEVNVAASATMAAARELSGVSSEISDGAQGQASSLEETAASLEEMTAAVRQNADNAQQAAQLSQSAREIAEKGGAVVNSAVGAMSEINASSRKIADIITAIDEIAFQTNLLALNAAVEAARAGEQGRGFAVVAGEVRNLAQRSASSAKEIKGLIQDSVQKVEAGSKLVNQSGETLEEIVTSVKRATDIVAEIAASSREQSAGIEQVNTAVTQMDGVTQANAARTQDLAHTAETLSSHADQMMQLVRRFRMHEKVGS